MTAKIKLNAASGGGSFSLQAPSSSSNNRVISLPDIADGTLVTSESTLDATKLSGNLPAISGANLTGISAGITMAETWRLTSTITNDGSENVITTNLAKQAAPSSYGKVGTETMTESSGVFTFPSTGIYYIVALQMQYALGSSTVGAGNGLYINSSTDSGSSFSRSAFSAQAVSSLVDYGSGSSHYIMDVTNVSTHKVRFSYSGTSGSKLAGNSGDNQTHFLFMKLGAT